MFRLLMAVMMLGLSANALAGTLAVVDFEKAVKETREGVEAQTKLDKMYSARKVEIERLRAELKKNMEDYQSRSMILSDDARLEAERELLGKQQRLEQTYSQYQQEMQQTYYQLLSGLDQRMRALTKVIAQEKNHDLVVDKAAVIYYGGDTVDMTGVLIKRYNAK